MRRQTSDDALQAILRKQSGQPFIDNNRYLVAGYNRIGFREQAKMMRYHCA
jgi:hypothetical protein